MGLDVKIYLSIACHDWLKFAQRECFIQLFIIIFMGELWCKKRSMFSSTLVMNHEKLYQETLLPCMSSGMEYSSHGI